ncbi:MAG: sulfur carrier protein ThiS [Acidobacteriaceae bacterium]
MALTLVLNGHTRVFPNLAATATDAELIAELALKGDRIAVERNGEIAERSRWREIILDAGDRLEVVHFVGGGCQ